MAQAAGAETEEYTSLYMRDIDVTAIALPTLTALWVLEDALWRVPGVHAVEIEELQDREAVFRVRIAPHTRMLAGLRQALGLAVDVVETRENGLSVSLPKTAPHRGEPRRQDLLFSVAA